MRLVKIGVAGVSVKVGDFASNSAWLRAAIGSAREAGVHLLVTPELGISGYSLEDRIYWADIADAELGGVGGAGSGDGGASRVSSDCRCGLAR